jgi:ferredoxin-NADP reductase
MTSVEAPPVAAGEGSYEVVVTARREEADGVVTLSLAAAGDGRLPAWEAGAHVDVLLPDGRERQYSLCGSDDEGWSISVLHAPEGRGGSAWVHSSVREGDHLHVRGPRNRFPLVPADRYVFVAGGIGITPVVAMVRALEAAGRTSWTLTYGGRTRDSMAFLAELEALGDRVTVVPQDTDGLIDLGRALGTPAIGTAVYCCGPEPLLVAVERACRSWPPGALHVERFAPVEVDATGDREFEVVAVRSGITATVAVGDTILQVLEDQGVSLPTSCGEGVCGTCETVVLEGEVDHRDAVLTEAEQATHTMMMVCCSRAKGDRLVLDV